MNQQALALFRPIRRIFATALIGLAWCAPSLAQEYPSRPIHMIVPANAGSATDGAARFVAEALRRDRQWNVVVENRVGANSMIGINAARVAAPDGYTILMAPSNLYLNKVLQPRLDYDPIADFTPIAKAASALVVLVAPGQSPIDSLPKAIEQMKANPGKLNFASTGVGSIMHMAFSTLAASAGVDAHHVPYKGADTALIDTVSGRIDLSFNSILATLPLVQAGKLKALAVSGRNRSAAMPDVPTVAELGFPGYEVVQGLAFVGPKGMDEAIADRLSREILTVLRTEAFAEFCKSRGLEPDLLSAAEYREAAPKEYARWTAAVKAAGIKPDQ